MSRITISDIIPVVLIFAFIFCLGAIAYSLDSNAPTYTEECELLAVEVESARSFQALAFFSGENTEACVYVTNSVEEFKDLRSNIGETYTVTHRMDYVQSIEKGGKD